LFQISVRGEGIEEAKNILSGYPARIRRALRNSIIDAARQTNSELNRLVLARYNITRANLKRIAKVRILSPKALNQEDVGGLSIVGPRAVPVMRFGVTPKTPPSQAGLPVTGRQQVSINVVKGGKTQIGVPNQFVIKMKSGHVGVFHRTKGSDSLPVDEEFRIGINSMIRSHYLRPRIEYKAKTVFEAKLYKNVEREFREIRRKGRP
jgi:hypothetical protein